ncbi:MAG: hypothetical protein IJ015_02035 [Ruminococcus sp.]|nr:hypothetical protein [Ruminococcus sp.]
MQNFQTNFNPYAHNQAIVKSYFKRPLVLVLAILYIVSIVCSLASSFAMGNTFGDMYSTMLNFTEAPSEVSDMFNSFSSSGLFTGFFAIAMIPSIILTALYATAYFIIYFKSKNENENSSPKAGFTILYVLAIMSLIYAIFVALLFVLFITLFIVGSIAMSQEPNITSEESTIFTVMFSVFAVIFAGMGAIMLIYAISNFNYIKSAKNSLCSANLSYKGATTYGVMSIIFGVSSFMSVLPSLMVAPIMNTMSQLIPSELESELPVEVFSQMSSLYLVSGIVSAISVAILIISAIIALGYKKHISNIKNGYFIPEPVFDAPTVQEATFNQPSPAVQPQKTDVINPDIQSQQKFEPVIFSDNETVAHVKHCPRCGTVAKEDDVFCNACGTKL